MLSVGVEIEMGNLWWRLQLGQMKRMRECDRSLNDERHLHSANNASLLDIPCFLLMEA